MNNGTGSGRQVIPVRHTEGGSVLWRKIFYRGSPTKAFGDDFHNGTGTGVCGVTLLELVLVLVIVAIGGALAYPSLQTGIENRQAKLALETLRTVSNAIRLYKIDKGVNNGPYGPLGDAPPHVLEATRYINPAEYAPGFSYGITPSGVTATRAKSGRVITLSQDGTINDTSGFLGPPP